MKIRTYKVYFNIKKMFNKNIKIGTNFFVSRRYLTLLIFITVVMDSSVNIILFKTLNFYLDTYITLLVPG